MGHHKSFCFFDAVKFHLSVGKFAVHQVTFQLMTVLQRKNTVIFVQHWNWKQRLQRFKFIFGQFFFNFLTCKFAFAFDAQNIVGVSIGEIAFTDSNHRSSSTQISLPALCLFYQGQIQVIDLFPVD